MSQNNLSSQPVEDIEEEDEFNVDDFNFTIGPDGELKSIMFPRHLMEDPPESVNEILKLFGIENLNVLENRTLH